MNSILRKEPIGGTHQKILRMHLVQNWISGKKKGKLEALSKKVNLMSEILARPVLRNNHLRKPHEKQIVPAKQRGILREKMHMLSNRD